jgi:hypothetical protein
MYNMLIIIELSSEKKVPYVNCRLCVSNKLLHIYSASLLCTSHQQNRVVKKVCFCGENSCKGRCLGRSTFPIRPHVSTRRADPGS